MSYSGRQAIVRADAVLTLLGLYKIAAGLVAAIACGAGLHAWMLLCFGVGSLILIRGMYWPTLLALIGAAYADWPAREAWGVELSSFPLLAVQALVAVPLWLAVMDYPSRLDGRRRSAAWVACGVAAGVGLAAPWLPAGSYWLAVAPLSLVAVCVLLVRIRRARVPFGTRGWACCLAALPATVWLAIFVLVPGTTQAPGLLLGLNLWLSTAPVALAFLNWRSPRHDRPSGKADPRMGPGSRRVLGWVRSAAVDRGSRLVRAVLPVGGAAVGENAPRLRVVPGGHGGEAPLYGATPARDRGRGFGRADGRGAQADARDDGRHAALRPAASPVGDDTGPLIPQERVG